MHIGVIISTYNSPQWLRRVLWGYECQTFADFETIIADDGSGAETKRVIDEFRQRGRLTIRHVRHDDDGFRKTAILNKAISRTRCKYIIITDGDCVPRSDLVATHASLAQPGHFLSAGYFKLSMPVSQQISEETIQSGSAFDYGWLRQQGQPLSIRGVRLTRQAWLARTLDCVTTTAATWNGANSSGWKSDIVAVNGFDERMQYGGLDRELGERLNNFGVKGIQIRYRAVCVHLDHPRGYNNPETWERNNAIRQQVRSEGLIWTPHGIVKADSLETATRDARKRASTKKSKQNSSRKAA